MEISFLIFLGGGLFLGWALGANDSANVFGTAVGTRMLRFGVAAMLCSIGVVLGAVISGAGATETLNQRALLSSLYVWDIAWLGKFARMHVHAG